jgi:aminoglycoside phosphotransferase (APT) family kinase protein
VREWQAEIVVDEALARRLLEGRFPSVAAERFRLLGEGWDNTVWLVDGRWVFRFPRRQIAVPGIERQVAVLPAIEPLLPLRVPRPLFAGAASAAFPWPFYGAELVPGRELAEAGLDDASRSALARPLGAFLRALHDLDVAAVPGAATLPEDPMGRADMTVRVARTRGRLDELRGLGLWEPPPALQRILVSAERLPAPPSAGLAHGDLHLRHVLIDQRGRAAAVIDWDDLCRGDPSIDVPLFWCALPPPARAEFLDAYGPVGEERLLRARVLAVFLCGTLAVYARREGLPALERESVRGLDLAMAD